MPRSRPEAPTDPSNFGYIEEMLIDADLRSIYIFLMQTVGKVAIRIDYTKGCIEIYPMTSDDPLPMQGIPPDAVALENDGTKSNRRVPFF